MKQYKLKYRKALIAELIRIKVKQNKNVLPVLSSIAHSGFTNFPFDLIENEIKQYYISLGGTNEDVENLLTELEYY